MSDPSKQADQEPSIEEILSSIRQIISDDDEDEDDKPDPLEDISDAEEEEPIVLTNKIEEEPVVLPDEEPAIEIDMKEPDEISSPSFSEELSALGDEFGVDFDDEPDEEFTEEPLEENIYVEEPAAPAPRAPSPRPKPEPAILDEEDSLLTQRAEDAAYGAFKKLAVKTAVDNISGITIEEIVRDEIRPMLREWLDDNLPSMVERLVKEELDRVARRALEE